jgi:outer membrane biosynthesis protein TonB
MATLEIPPNPPPPPPPPAPSQPEPIKIRAGRYGDLEQQELLHLLESFDDERSRGRFRESIYFSIIVYLCIAWLLIWGPRVLFHRNSLITAKNAEHDKISSLDLPSDLPKLKIPKVAPKPPVLDQKTMDRIKTAPVPKAAPSPAPPAPAPAPAPAASAPTPPPPPTPPTPAPALPSAPTPQPRPSPSPSNSIPDAPRPNFNAGGTAGDNIRNAARPSGSLRGSGIRSEPHSVGQQAASSGIEILSDPMNVDWGPYLKRLLAMVKGSWYPLIPEECYPPLSKEGTTLIRFTIMPDGSLKPNAMRLDGSTHDEAIDRAAWGSITGIGVFPPLPAEFKGPNLELRIQFVISRTPMKDY